MSTRINVSYRIMGLTDDPAGITSLLGVQPTKTWRSGEQRHPRTTLTHAESGWEWQAALGESETLADGVDKIIQTFQHASPKLAKIGRGGTKQVYCGLSIYGDDRPEISLSQAQLKGVSELGAALDIDLMIYPGE